MLVKWIKKLGLEGLNIFSQNINQISKKGFFFTFPINVFKRLEHQP